MGKTPDSGKEASSCVCVQIYFKIFLLKDEATTTTGTIRT